jgi:tRNA threonylcarbamoyl adenosine modification protein YjeE
VTGLDALIGRHQVASPDDMEQLGRRMGGMLAAGDLVVLTGPLGAGKTTLTRGIAEGLSVRGPVQSPTFVIARTHPSLVGAAPLVHVDAYRLGSAIELDDLDIDVDRSVVVVEWGRGMVEGLRDTWWEVELSRTRGEGSPDPADEDVADPRVVTVARRSG